MLPADFNPDENTSGFGMKLVQILARQIGGTFALAADPDGVGNLATVTFPANIGRL